MAQRASSTASSARSSSRHQEVDLAYSVAGPRPLPLQRLPAARHGRPGPARHPDADQDDRRARAAAGPQADRRGRARPGARHRHHRQRQEHDARRDGRPHQRDARGAHHDGRGPDRVPAPRQPVDRQPARGRGRHAVVRARAAQRACARIPTSSWSAKCATSRRSRPRCSPPKPATSCSRRCTRSTRPRRSTASSRSSRRTSSGRSASSSRRVLKAAISQRLMPRADGKGRVAGGRSDDRPPPSSATASSTRTRRRMIHGAIAAGTSQYGMQTFDQSIFASTQQGLVTLEEALRWATNVDEFKLKVQGISTTADMARDEMASKRPRGATAVPPASRLRPPSARPSTLRRTIDRCPSGRLRRRPAPARPPRALRRSSCAQRLLDREHAADDIDARHRAPARDGALDDARVARGVSRGPRSKSRAAAGCGSSASCRRMGIEHGRRRASRWPRSSATSTSASLIDAGAGRRSCAAADDRRRRPSTRGSTST